MVRVALVAQLWLLATQNEDRSSPPTSNGSHGPELVSRSAHSHAWGRALTKAFQRFGTIRLFKMREPEAPEDVETSALMRHVIEYWMQAVTERVRLQKLRAS